MGLILVAGCVLFTAGLSLKYGVQFYVANSCECGKRKKQEMWKLNYKIRLKKDNYTVI